MTSFKNKHLTPLIVIMTLSLGVLTFNACASAGEGRLKSLQDVNEWFVLFDYTEDSHLAKNPSLMLDFDLVMLDADAHPPLQPVKGFVNLIGYVSIGEAEVYRFYWERIKNRPWVLHENPNWEGNFYVDVRHEEWRRLLIDEIFPRIIDEGFEGVFMDTIDTAEYLEGVYPDKYPGIRDAMVELVREIHEAFPDFKLISNNGFTVLERIAPYLSGMLSEDIHMMVDFENDSYQPVPEEDYDYKVEMLQRLMKRYDLPVFNIDYVSQKNHRLRKKLIRKSQRLGFKPYVAETNLSEIYEQ